MVIGKLVFGVAVDELFFNGFNGRKDESQLAGQLIGSSSIVPEVV